MGGVEVGMREGGGQGGRVDKDKRTVKTSKPAPSPSPLTLFHLPRNTANIWTACSRRIRRSSAVGGAERVLGVM